MKKLMIISAIVTALGTQAAVAGEHTEAKQAGAFFTTSIVGAVLGGPVGAIAGALGGAWIGDELKQADQVEGLENKLAYTTDSMGNLRARLAKAENDSRRFEKMAMAPIEMQLLFKTNQSELASEDMERVAQIARYLKNNPDVTIQLDGYADPRGDEQYNQVLSEARVSAIAEQLESEGLDESRIVAHSHGASFSKARTGDHDAYALERVVKIKMTRDRHGSSIAQTNNAY